MLSYEQDPDVVRWGLQLFKSDPYSNQCCQSGTQTSGEDYGDQILNEGHHANEFTGPEINEFTALSLQEQLAQFSVTEPPQVILDNAEYTPQSYYQQDWLNQSIGTSYVGEQNENDNNTALALFPTDEESGSREEIEMAVSFASPAVGEEELTNECSYTMELMDEYDIDCEVGKRFIQLVPVPHIPRINGEIPSLDEATLDHQRLLERLQVYELLQFKVQGDGNCQFRALSDQFYRTPEHHEFVRQHVVNQLKSFPEIYEGYVPMAYDDYLEKMSRNGEWGDHVTLQAASDSYGVKIFVITSFKDTCYIEIQPNTQKSERVIFLSFWAEVHYNSIYPEGDVSTFQNKRKRQPASLHDHFDTRDDCN